MNTASEICGSRIAKLEAASKTSGKEIDSAVSRKDFEFAIETIGRFVGKELNPILQRIEKLEARLRGEMGRRGMTACAAQKAS